MSPSRRGLRLEIVLALAGLLVLAFVPLFFAVTSIGRAALAAEREDGARALVSVVALEVAREREGPSQGAPITIFPVLARFVDAGAIASAAVYDGAGRRLAAAGPEADALAAPPPATKTRSDRFARARVIRAPHARLLEVAAPAGDLVVVARVYAGEVDRSEPLVRLVAIYVGAFAVALLVFAYFVLTRLIVRPLEALSHAASRVAGGARSLAIPESGGREIRDLGLALRTMTDHLLREEEKLRTKVAELVRTTDRLTSTNVQLERSDRMASVGRLAAGVAHEIGNPLAALLGLEDLVLDGGLDESAQRDFVLRMKKETERINGVVRDLLDFSRAGQGDDVGPTVVRGVFDDVIALVKPQKELRNIDVVVEAGNESVRLGSGRLTQVILNLVLNAASAIDGGGAIRLRARRDGDAVRIEVEDTGPGVPAAMHETIFEPFVTTKEVGAGTGLGLSVCRGIVEGAGGRIRVDGSYEGGARFVVELPPG